MADLPHILISYKDGEGEPYIKQIEDEMAPYGFSFWYAKRNIGIGERWEESIDRAIETALAVIVVITPGIRASSWVTYEWSYAFGLRVPVVPLMFEDVPTETLHDKLYLRMHEKIVNPTPDLWHKLHLHLEGLALGYPEWRAQRLLEIIQDTQATVEDRQAAISEVTAYKSDAVLDVFRRLMNEEQNILVRASVIYALGNMRDKYVVRDLIKIADLGDIILSVTAVGTLGSIGDPAAGPAVTKLLKSTLIGMCSTAAEALGKMQYKPAVDDLTPLLHDANDATRWLTARALGLLGVQSAVIPLTQVLTDHHVNVKQYALEALERLGDPRAVPAIIPVLNDNDIYHANHRICEVAARVLRHFATAEALDAVRRWEEHEGR